MTEKTNPKCFFNRKHACEECSYFYAREDQERQMCQNDEEDKSA